MAVKHPDSPRIAGAMAGLGVVALAALFFLVLLPGTSNRVAEQRAKIPPLSAWSNARVFTELGDYDQRIPDCVGLTPGLTAYVWVDEGQRRILIICKE